MSSLPKLDIPTYSVTLPITKQTITFRPYLTKEEKILLMAVESKSPKTILESMGQIATNCVVMPEKFDIQSLPIVDLEHLFLNLRAKSKSEVLEAQFTCKNEINKNAEEPDVFEPCNAPITLKTRIDELSVENIKDFSDIIPLTKKIGVKMRLPRYKDVIELFAKNESALESATQMAFEVIISSIESIYDENEIYKVDKSNRKNVEEFLGALTSEQFNKIQNFLENVPKINYKFQVKCNSCGFDHTLNYKDISNFF